ncbi:unnamed protein product [Phytophthora fragariaefolia]|uniref:Unnamed protein product n=1 Tax=Phytophthora fragariaefolia TaxID=1490495 RepID=A0A9W6Y6F8_9STRA|nr:unnamed protein product [Phytophthora fragariaefolia]
MARTKKKRMPKEIDQAMRDNERVNATPAASEEPAAEKRRQARLRSKRYNLNNEFQALAVDATEATTVAVSRPMVAAAVQEPAPGTGVPLAPAPTPRMKRLAKTDVHAVGPFAEATHSQTTTISEFFAKRPWHRRRAAQIASHDSVFSLQRVEMACGVQESLLLRGAVQLPPLAPAPPRLLQLYGDVQFRRLIRAYNQVFAFKSIGASCSNRSFNEVNQDESVAGQHGVYTYRIQGAMGHYLGSLLPRVDPLTNQPKPVKFAQIYIVDPDMQQRAERRRGIFADLDPGTLLDIEQMMTEVNPFAQQFLNFAERLRQDQAEGKDVVDMVYRLHEKRSNPHTYNLPTVSEVGATLIEDGNLECPRDILLWAKGHNKLRLVGSNPMYDPLQYPLLLPHGGLGWTYTDTYRRFQTKTRAHKTAARVYQMKLAALLQDLDEGVLGRVQARMYVAEFQKRGLPHAHILAILTEEDKPRTWETMDKLVSAELTDPKTNPQLYETIPTCMMHDAWSMRCCEPLLCLYERREMYQGIPQAVDRGHSMKREWISSLQTQTPAARCTQVQGQGVRQCYNQPVGRSVQPVPFAKVQLPHQRRSLYDPHGGQVSVQVRVQGIRQGGDYN